MKQRGIFLSLVTVGIFFLAGYMVYRAAFVQPRGVRGKAPAATLRSELSPQQVLAQDLALSEPRVQDLTAGKRSEVFGVRAVGQHFTPASQACAQARCWQVEIYNFNQNEAVVAIVDVDARQVLDVLHQPGVHPGINQRLADLALDIAIHHPDVVAALGFQPQQADMAPVDADLIGTACDQGHLCVAPTFELNDRILWAVVDLTTEQLAGLAWTEMDPDAPQSSTFFTPQGCPAPGSVNRDGWTLDYETSGTDGLRVYNVGYNTVPVITSVKLVEWHADYGTNGFRDSTGCGGGGGGFPIYPYGETQVLDLTDPQGAVIGFEVVQDFRMSNWGNFCNYRYEQHLQFFSDGRFRVVSGAYGKGCGNNALYRPVVRIDIAVAGDDGDTFSFWDSNQWIPVTVEDYRVPYPDPGHGPHAMTPEGYSWRVDDRGGLGYTIEQDIGQFDGDRGRGSNPFWYVTLHHANEGDADLGVIGACCNDDHQQGPDQYVNGEAVADENVVLWYVPQMETDVTAGSYYCWTLQGEPNPDTYPCFSGPMFHPTTPIAPLAASFLHNAPVDLGETAVFTNTSTGLPPLSYLWDFGDGITSTLENPTHLYGFLGNFAVTLTASNPQASDIFSDTFTVGIPAQADFFHNSPISPLATAIFTNTSTGTQPLTYLWDFGDGATSSDINPSHQYTITGVYSVTLEATNSLGSSTASQLFLVGVAPLGTFTFNQPVIVDQPVSFSHLIVGGQTYFWDFGDGIGTSTEENPTYVYSQTGIYTVRLIATNLYGEVEVERMVVVNHPLYMPAIEH